jgi:hypothetical protein
VERVLRQVLLRYGKAYPPGVEVQGRQMTFTMTHSYSVAFLICLAVFCYYLGMVVTGLHVCFLLYIPLTYCKVLYVFLYALQLLSYDSSFFFFF